MAQQNTTITSSTTHLDPEHTSCIGGRTALTCPSCAGNATRGSICSTCEGRGFNMFICAHCNPAAAAVAVRTALASRTPDSSTLSTPVSLSRSSSTSFSPQSELKTASPWKRLGDGDAAGGGRVGANTSAPRSI